MSRQAGPVSSGPPPEPVDDPVLARRARVIRWCSLGQRVGYLSFGLAVMLFVAGFLAQFPAWLVTLIVGLMVSGSVVLLPAIIFGFAARAADREDRGERVGY